MIELAQVNAAGIVVVDLTARAGEEGRCRSYVKPTRIRRRVRVDERARHKVLHAFREMARAIIKINPVVIARINGVDDIWIWKADQAATFGHHCIWKTVTIQVTKSHSSAIAPERLDFSE